MAMLNHSNVNEYVGVADFFCGRSLFITGATGFMGKVLVEKLLRSCPGIVKIYVLMRPSKNGQSVQDKLAKTRASCCFDKLKQEHPGDLETKLYAISGDMTKLNLGLTVEDRNRLLKEVSIVYHMAATVRFNQPLTEAIIMNVRGTREVCKLVNNIREYNKETILVHISTAYAHTNRKFVDEILYPAETDWNEAIEIAENLDVFTCQILSAKYMNGFPNTYTFTKSLAEHVVANLCGQGGNTIILRPSIVISAAKEPMAGWIDNFNGPTAMMAASATGIVRISYVNKEVIPDYMTVDVAIKAIIMVAWKQFIDKRCNNASSAITNVYNCTAYRRKAITFKDMIDLGIKAASHVALKDTLWYPSTSTTNIKLWYYINVMIFHLIPAVILDASMKCFGIKQRSIVEVQRKIYVATMSLAYFMTNQWNFLNTKVLALEHELSDTELAIFGYDIDNIDNLEYFKNASLGAKKYLLKEDMTRLDKDVANLNMLYYLDKIVKISFYASLVWFVFFKTNLLKWIGI